MTAGQGAGEGPTVPPPYAVVDVDGVLADVRHRLHHLQRRPKDWDAFFAAAVDDPALAEGLAVARTLGADHEIVYLTGRPERCRAATLSWLQRHDLPPGPLLMRRDGDRRPARLAKLERLRRLAAQRPVAVLVDDDDAVRDAATAAGFTVLAADWMPPSEGQADQETLFVAQERDGRT